MALYQRNGVWWIKLYAPGNKLVRESTGTTSRKEAQRYHDRRKAELASLKPLSGYTWGAAVESWCSEEHRSISDIQSMAKFGRYYADRAIEDVDVASLTEALDKLCHTAATWNRYRARIQAILNHAVKYGWLSTAPKLPRKKVTPTPREWITPEQWQRLYKALPEHQRDLAEFSLETGLRQSNVLNLRWAQIDWDNRVVAVEAVNAKGRKMLLVALSDRAIEILRARYEAEPRHPEYVFTRRWKGELKPITEIKTAWQRACVEADLGYYDEQGHYHGFTWHGLRHSWATWHVQNGTPLEILEKLGGWSDARMVKNYARILPEHIAKYANNHRKENTP